MRYVVQQAVPRDALFLEEKGREGLRLVEQGDQHIADLQLGLLRRRGVPDGPLEHALESLGLHRLLVIDRGNVLFEKSLDLLYQVVDVAPAHPDDIPAEVVVQRRIQDMLGREVLVPPRLGLLEGGHQYIVQLIIDFHHASSYEHLSGNSRAFAIWWTWLTLVTAISRV